MALRADQVRIGIVVELDAVGPPEHHLRLARRAGSGRRRARNGGRPCSRSARAPFADQSKHRMRSAISPSSTGQVRCFDHRRPSSAAVAARAASSKGGASSARRRAQSASPLDLVQMEIARVEERQRIAGFRCRRSSGACLRRVIRFEARSSWSVRLTCTAETPVASAERRLYVTGSSQVLPWVSPMARRRKNSSQIQSGPCVSRAVRWPEIDRPFALARLPDEGSDEGGRGRRAGPRARSGDLSEIRVAEILGDRGRRERRHAVVGAREQQDVLVADVAGGSREREHLPPAVLERLC